jgi:hypothetical protein
MGVVDEPVRQEHAAVPSMDYAVEQALALTRTMSSSVSAARAQPAQAVGRTAGRPPGSIIAMSAPEPHAQHRDLLSDEVFTFIFTEVLLPPCSTSSGRA